MLFNSWQFLTVFLPVVLLIGLVVLRGFPRLVFLVAASFVFYAEAGVLHAIVLFAAICWVHALVGQSDAGLSTQRVVLAIAVPMGILFYFKYSGFFVREFLHPIGMTFVPVPVVTDKTLPAGVSFFTFQLVSYVVDRKRGIIPKPLKLPQFALLIGFFPHLVAGPILRYRDVARGLIRLPYWRLRLEALAAPITYICCGLAFKVLLADRLAAAIGLLLKQLELVSRTDSAFVILAYSYQIYFDFYGYSLIAIGLGLLFGLSFPANFNRPYTAPNPREFWRRWHITLSYWIRDYVYFPLGGNKRYVRNILITFALFGLWHGAGWNYVIWGLYHAGLVIAYHLTKSHWDRMPHVLQALSTFTLMSLGWLLFLFDFKGLQAFIVQFISPAAATGGSAGLMDWMMLLTAAAVAQYVRVEDIAERACLTTRGSVLWGGGMAAVLFAVALFLDTSGVFIYFRF